MDQWNKHPFIHPSLFAEKFSHNTQQSYENRAGQKVHSAVTLTFAQELHKYNITNDKIQNQKNQHYILFVSVLYKYKCTMDQEL